MSELERIAYDNALRALDKQEKVVEETRARTAVIVAASSLAASLLGGRALSDADPPWLAFAALAALLTSLGASLFVLLPRGLVFAVEGRTIYERFYDLRDDDAELLRRLAYHLARVRRLNDEIIAPVQRALTIAACAMTVEILALSILAADIL